MFAAAGKGAMRFEPDSMREAALRHPVAARARSASVDRSSAVVLVARLLVYAALGAGAFQMLVMAGSGGDIRWLVRDDGPLELAELVAIVLTAVLLFLLAREREHIASILRVMGAFALMAAARELDNLTLELGWRHAYKVLALPAAAYAAWLLVAKRSVLGRELITFARSPGFTLIATGFFVVVIYSQILGQKVLWQAVVGADAYRPVKDLVEEASELLGYLLIAFGAAEACLNGDAD